MLDEWGTYLARREGILAATVTAYKKDVREALEYVYSGQKADAHLEEVFTARSLRSWLGHRLDSGLSRATVARNCAAVRKLGKWLVYSKYLPADPTSVLSVKSSKTRLPEILKDDQIQKLLDYLRQQALQAQQQDDSINSAETARNWALVELLYGAGLRVEELCSLNIESIQSKRRYVRVIGKGSKERVVPYGIPADDALKLWLGVRETFALQRAAGTQPLFLGKRGGRLNQRVARDVVYKSANLAGVPQIAPHALRHTSATQMLQGGADLRYVQDFLGHSSLQTTQRYTHVDGQRLVNIYRQSHPRA